MAIKIVTGVPGAGKSYYIVNHIAENYCEKFGDTFKLKPGYKIVTNVEGLLLDVDDFDQVVERAGGVKKFFNVKVQEEITEKYKKENIKIVYIIDEAQSYFDRRFYDKEVFFFFQKHRHMGLDIYLLTQHSNLLPKDLIQLSEFEIRAVPRSVSFGNFCYAKKVCNQKINTIMIRRKKHIFALYKSMSQRETEKIKNPFLKWLVILPLLIVFSIFSVIKQFSPEKVEASQKAESAAVSGDSVSVGSRPGDKKNKSLDLEHVKTDPFEYKKVKLSHVMWDLPGGKRKVKLYDPVTEKLMDIRQFPYKVGFIRSGDHYNFFANIPVSEIKKDG